MPHLPRGHKIEVKYIVRESHPKITLLEKGKRIIVGRRAADRVAEAIRV